MSVICFFCSNFASKCWGKTRSEAVNKLKKALK